jgi:hypothetical protein
MQYRGECWAGNSRGKYGKRPDKECNMRCKKDNSRICGAGWRNSVFKLVVTEKVYKSIVGESQYGCFKDSGKRDLPTLLRKGYGNPKKCFELAMAGNYKFAGLQYRGECWAGNSVGKYGKRPDGECNMKCKYDSSRMCGAGWRNSVYKLVWKEKGYTSIIGETEEGCYKDSGRRDLPTLLRAGYGRPKKCFELARDAGF